MIELRLPEQGKKDSLIVIEPVKKLPNTSRIVVFDAEQNTWSVLYATTDQLKQLHTQLGEYLAETETSHECKFRN